MRLSMNHSIARLWPTAVVAIAGILLSGCGGGGDSPISPPPDKTGDPASLTLNYPQPTLARGQALDLRATVKDAAGNELSKAVTWSTSDASVAAVQPGSNTAALRAGRTGTATVTATLGNLTSASTVSVVAFASVTAGPGYSCALTTAHKLYCAGLSYGPLAVPLAPSLDFLAVTIRGRRQCFLHLWNRCGPKGLLLGIQWLWTARGGRRLAADAAHRGRR